MKGVRDMKAKKGDISMTLTLIISLVLLVSITINIINMLVPFIWYQKLENIANKYIYVVERFGYLTQDEEKELYEELKNDGFDVSNVTFKCPKERLAYGKQFEFSIEYNMPYNSISAFSGVKNEARYVLLHVKKYGYSKI